MTWTTETSLHWVQVATGVARKFFTGGQKRTVRGKRVVEGIKGWRTKRKYSSLSRHGLWERYELTQQVPDLNDSNVYFWFSKPISDQFSSLIHSDTSTPYPSSSKTRICMI